MKTILQNRWLIWSLRIILGVIFIVSSIAKIQDLEKFVIMVASYHVLPESMAHLYGYVVPWVELFIGCTLVLGVFIHFSAALLIPLVISFIVASSDALVNAVGGSCGCFGKFLTLSHPVSLTIDVFILFSALILLINKGKYFLSIGQLVDKLTYKYSKKDSMPRIKNFLPQIGRLSCVILVMVIIATVAIGIHTISKPAEKVVETVNIPSPFGSQVDQALLQNKPVLLEFYVDGCSLCEAAAPTISNLEKSFNSQVVFIRIEYYSNPQAVSDLKVTTAPTVFVIVSKTSQGFYNVLCRVEEIVDQASLQTFIQKAIELQ